MAPRIGTSFWKVAGLSYLQYLNVSTRALSKALKEPAKGRALARQSLSYNKTVGDVKVAVKQFLP